MKEEQVKIGQHYKYMNDSDFIAHVLSKHDGQAYCKLTRYGSFSDYVYIAYGDLHAI